MKQDGKWVFMVANFKCNKTWAETEAYLQQFRGFREEGRVMNVLCLPYPYLIKAAEMIGGMHLPVKLGAQDISPYPFGRYTGAVAAGMLMGMVDYAIVGHSERRRYFKETDQEVAQKVAQLVEVGMTPIVCLDSAYLESQLAAIEAEYLLKCIFVYEPSKNISTDGQFRPDDPDHAAKEAGRIQEKVGGEVRVLYGGSVTEETLGSFLQKSQLTGVLVGEASRNVGRWKHLLVQAAHG